MLFSALLFSGFISIKESEKRAATIFVWSAILTPPIYILVLFSGSEILKWIICPAPWALLLYFFFPNPFRKHGTFQIPASRIDERDIMFSRRLLKKNTARYNDYYNRFPDRKDDDDRSRSRPGLLSRESTLYHPVSFVAAKTAFDTIEALAGEIDGPVHPDKQDLNAVSASRFLKNWAKKMGALEVGITGLKEYHLYSFRGRDQNYGRKVMRDHDFAIAFTVEMDKEMMDAAPKGPTVMESAGKYLNAGIIAVLLAKFIRNMGYPARAHIDGNYEVVCPLVARDAGLGDIGRMGVLMTPELGPRVRIGVVTTNMELEPDLPKPDPSMLHFCELCKKCAAVCPGQSISFESGTEVEGIKRWRIDQGSCYDYWCKTGTDCGRCMAVCPYSHPNNILHNMVRYGIKNSTAFRRLAVLLDDLFYGKKPKSKDYPDWMGG